MPPFTDLPEASALAVALSKAQAIGELRAAEANAMLARQKLVRAQDLARRIHPAVLDDLGLVKAFLAQAFFIPSESMEPQLATGDRVVVSRLSYDLHDPRRRECGLASVTSLTYDCGKLTAWAAPVLSGRFAPTDELPPVWPAPEGDAAARQPRRNRRAAERQRPRQCAF